jgi:hypothetical protein
MARGEQPLAGADDGDTLFAVTTGGAKGITISDEEMDDLGMLASEAAWDAILSSLPPLPVKTIRTNVVPPSQVLDGMVGHYAFAADAIAELRRKGPSLELEITGPTNNYFTAGTPALLTAIATDEFEVAGPRADRLHIDRDEHGVIVGITLNPGLWAIHATRK